jgi:hypothetical protein
MNQAAYEAKIARYTWQGVEMIQFNKFPLLEKYAYIQFTERFDETRSISKIKGSDILRHWRQGQTALQRQCAIQKVRRNLIDARNALIVSFVQKALSFIEVGQNGFSAYDLDLMADSCERV